jgi:hypothetical protein
MLRLMGDPGIAAGHVFLCYAREDSARVDELEGVLRAARIPVWRDTEDLWPGQDWRVHVRRAITEGALVFLACFSQAALTKGRRFQHAELALAAEQARLRPADEPWLIPVRFDDCEIPEVDLGGGRTLAGIQRADLFGDHAAAATGRLVDAVRQILSANPGTAMRAGPQQGRAAAFDADPIRVLSAAEATARLPEHRVTELFAKAAEMLGSDKAAARLAGLYALERLAQDNPGYRQTMVNVLCAYLRMSFTPPAGWSGLPTSASKVRPGSLANSEVFDELQVRLTAESILSSHLRDRRRRRERQQAPAFPHFREDLSLDLSGAVLVNSNCWVGCRLDFAIFSQATFFGGVNFAHAEFGQTLFHGTRFAQGSAHFFDAWFEDRAIFVGADFGSERANFDSAHFHGVVFFNDAVFRGGVTFDNAEALLDFEHSWGSSREWPPGWREDSTQPSSQDGWIQVVPDHPGIVAIRQPANSDGVRSAGKAPGETAQDRLVPARNEVAWAARLFAEAERNAYGITNEHMQASALISVAAVLANTDPNHAAQLLADAEHVARTMTDEIGKPQVMVHVVNLVAATNPDRAERIAHTITNESSKASALHYVAKALAVTDPGRAERIAHTITDEQPKVYALSDIARALTTTDPSHATQLLTDAEHIAHSITDKRFTDSYRASLAEGLKASLLGNVAEALAAINPDRAERITHAITDERWKVRAMREIAETLATTEPGRATQLLTDAERIAHTITNEHFRAYALREVARGLAVIDPDRAERLARIITDAYNRALALRDVARALTATDPGRATQILIDAERTARTVADAGSKEQVMREVSKALVATDPGRATQILAEAEHIIRSLGDTNEVWALVDIAKTLADMSCSS